MLNSVPTSIESDFTAFVDQLAVGLLELSPTFEAFVQGMPGVLPDEALASLRRMGGERAQLLIADAAVDRAPRCLDQGAKLPLPHPLDSEFRFDVESARILAAALVDATRPGDEILLIGVPSVAVELAVTGADRIVRYLGPANSVTRAVADSFGDGRLILEQGRGGTAAAALLDPPWYQEPMRHLLAVGAFGCRPGALVNVALPSLGTRPEIELDRETFVGFALDAGLVATDNGGPVYYRTPLFELAALERQGIARLPSWRRGDVVEFRVGDRRVDMAPWSPPRSEELTIDGVRIRVVANSPGGSEKLIPISDHEVFPSVSARAAGRGAATLWTTTNRAFIVEPDLARRALSAFAAASGGVLQSRLNPHDNDLNDLSRVADLEHLIHQVSELVGRELFDARRLVGDDAWFKTAVEWRF